MIDAPFDVLDPLGRFRRRALRQRGGACLHRFGQRAAQLRCGVGELEEPQRLDADALADQCGFREILAQRRHYGSVAAIDGGERGQGGGLSGGFHAIAACSRSARLNMITHWVNA
jgi:hypothetical protein